MTNISPATQERLFHLFMVITIPLVWTGVVLACYYVSITFPIVYIYISIAAAVYIASQYYIIYPAKQRMKGVTHVMEQDQKEGHKPVAEKSTQVSDIRQRYNISTLDKILIFLGLVRDPLEALPDLNNLRFTLKLFTRAWVQRIHGAFDRTGGIEIGTIEDHKNKKREPGTYPRSVMVPDKEMLSRAVLAASSGLEIDHETAPAFLRLQEFANEWEKKWHSQRDFFQADNIHIREQYVGGDPEELLQLHVEAMKARAVHEGRLYEEDDEEGEEKMGLVTRAH